MDPSLKNWIATTDRVVSIEWRTWFPYQGDPFYLATQADAQARVALYNVGSAPSIRMDGTKVPWPRSPTGYQSTYDQCVASAAPVAISLSGTFNAGSGTASVDVMISPDAAVAGNARLFAAVTESEFFFEQNNGIDVHHHLLRQLVSGADGPQISFSGAGDPAVTHSIPFTVDGGWDADHVALVVIVQDIDTGEVLQAAEIPVSDLDPATPVEVSSWGELKTRF